MKPTDKPFWIPIQYICILLTTICFIGLNVAGLIFVWVIALLFWLFIPVIIIAGISFFLFIKVQQQTQKNIIDAAHYQHTLTIVLVFQSIEHM